MDTPAGTAGNDTFTATGATLGAQDVITGGAGTDKLVIVDTTKASEAGLAAATITGVEALELNTNGGVGVFAGSTTTQSAAAEVETITVTVNASNVAITDIVLTVGTTTYSSSSLTVNSTSASEIKTAVDTLIAQAFGDSVTIGSATSGVHAITAKSTGTPIPDFSIAMFTGGGTTTASTATAVRSQTTAAKEEKAVATSIAPVQTITLAAGADGVATGDIFYAHVDGIRVVASTGGTSISSAATAVASTINSIAGKTIASATGSVVTILGTAGEPLPLIGVSIFDAATTSGGPTSTTSIARQSSEQVSAAASAIVYDASGFTEAFTANGAGDMNVKAAATTDVTLSNTTGKIEVSGGDNVTVSTTGTGTTGIKGTALASVSVKGGGNVTVNNIGGTTASPVDNTGTTLTSVTLQGIAGSTAGIGSDAVTTVNLTKQLSALATTVTNAKSTSLNVNADAAGYDKDGGDVTVSVAAGAAAKTMNVSAATKSQLTVSGAALETLTVAGTGAAKINGLSSLALKSVTSTNTAGVTLGALNAATRTLTTGDGDDSATVAATTVTFHHIESNPFSAFRSLPVFSI